MQRVPGTRHVWHSSRLFCFGWLPAPVLHLFAGPVWCGVNNIQTYTHALISIHSGRQCRTPCLLWGWHFGKGQIHLAKNLCLYPAHHVPRLSVVLPENSLCLSSQNIFFVRADRRGFINLCHITGGNTCGHEWHRNTGQKNASCVKHHVVRVVSGWLFKLGGWWGQSRWSSSLGDPQKSSMLHLLPPRHESISLSLEQQWPCGGEKKGKKKTWQGDVSHSPDLNVQTAASVSLKNNRCISPLILNSGDW